jgi:hypothetical protein
VAWRRLTFLVLAALVAAGCATREKYDMLVRGWVGHPSDALVRSWGPPNGDYKLQNGNVLLLYETASVQAYTSPTQIYQAPGTVVGRVYYPGPTTVTGGETTTDQKRCRTQFEVDPSGTIVGYGFEGNACRARH